MRLRIGLFFGIGLLVSFAHEALADKRVALVIGNSVYKHASKLPNPANDAAAISVLFKTAGFDVIESRHNLGIVEMRKAIRDFTDKVRDADIAIVYSAGHGMEVDGINYLLPVDAALERDIDVEDEAISLDRIVRILDPAKRLRLVILDACRDNPFIQTMKRTMGTRSAGRGLAKIEPTSSDTLIAFAAKAGSTASDGSGTNSPFTTALVNNITTPGLDLRIAFGRVRDEVLKSTNNKQEPFVYGSLGGTTVALLPPTAEPITPPNSNATGAPPPTPSESPTVEIRRDYENAEKVGSKEAWEAFLAIHSGGFYANLARQRLAKLNAEEAVKAKPPVAARPPEPSQAPTAQPKTGDSSRTAAPSGQMICDARGCRPVKPGCKIASPSHQSGQGMQVEVCN